MESPVEALKLCDQGQTFDLIISDIEMPDMSGFEFAQKVKGMGAWQNTDGKSAGIFKIFRKNMGREQV